MNDDQLLLVTAALDGELTADELARAEADGEVAAEIERLREVRHALANVAPLSAERRRAVMAAALDTFDELAASIDRDTPSDTAPSVARSAVVAPPPASLAARRRARWVLPAAAAALVGVAAVGAIIGTGGSGGSDDMAADDTALERSTGVTASVLGGDTLSVTADSGGAAESGPAVSTADGSDEIDAGSAEITATPPLLVSTPAELVAYATGRRETSGAADATGEQDAPAVTMTVVASTASPADRDEDSDATTASDPAGSAGGPIGPSCPVQAGEYLGTIAYGADHETAVIVDVVRRGDLVTALETTGCTTVVTAPVD